MSEHCGNSLYWDVQLKKWSLAITVTLSFQESAVSTVCHDFDSVMNTLLRKFNRVHNIIAFGRSLARNASLDNFAVSANHLNSLDHRVRLRDQHSEYSEAGFFSISEHCIH